MKGGGGGTESLLAGASKRSKAKERRQPALVAGLRAQLLASKTPAATSCRPVRTASKASKLVEAEPAATPPPGTWFSSIAVLLSISVEPLDVSRFDWLRFTLQTRVAFYRVSLRSEALMSHGEGATKTGNENSFSPFFQQLMAMLTTHFRELGQRRHLEKRRAESGSGAGTGRRGRHGLGADGERGPFVAARNEARRHALARTSSNGCSDVPWNKKR